MLYRKQQRGESNLFLFSRKFLFLLCLSKADFTYSLLVQRIGKKGRTMNDLFRNCALLTLCDQNSFWLSARNSRVLSLLTNSVALSGIRVFSRTAVLDIDHISVVFASLVLDYLVQRGFFLDQRRSALRSQKSYKLVSYYMSWRSMLYFLRSTENFPGLQG